MCAQVSGEYELMFKMLRCSIAILILSVVKSYINAVGFCETRPTNKSRVDSRSITFKSTQPINRMRQRVHEDRAFSTQYLSSCRSVLLGWMTFSFLDIGLKLFCTLKVKHSKKHQKRRGFCWCFVSNVDFVFWSQVTGPCWLLKYLHHP